MTEPVKKQIPLAEATADQLAEFAQTTLGLEIKPRTPPHIIKGKIAQAGYDKDHITLFVRDTEQTPAAPGAREAMDAAVAPKSRKMVAIIIQAEKGKGGSEPVFVSVNGKAMWIPRGQRVEVPEEYVHALQNAVTWEYDETEIDLRTGNIGGLGEPRPVQAYPFQRVA